MIRRYVKDQEKEERKEGEIKEVSMSQSLPLSPLLILQITIFAGGKWLFSIHLAD